MIMLNSLLIFENIFIEGFVRQGEFQRVFFHSSNSLLFSLNFTCIEKQNSVWATTSKLDFFEEFVVMINFLW